MANILKIFKGNNKLRADQVYYNSTTSLLDAMWPVGRGFIDFTNTDYSNWLGFTWERELVGMTAVGLDTTQTEFNIIGKTGGSKYLQEHRHNINTGNRANAWETPNLVVSYQYQSTDPLKVTGVIESAGVGDGGNLQPYKVVAYWKRVS